MKKILILFCAVMLVACNKKATSNDIFNEKSKTEVQKPVKKVIKPTNKITYTTPDWRNVELRIVTLEGHKYVVATNYTGRAGAIDIEHAESCHCLKK